jgi:hypothetical protein
VCASVGVRVPFDSVQLRWCGKYECPSRVLRSKKEAVCRHDGGAGRPGQTLPLGPLLNSLNLHARFVGTDTHRKCERVGAVLGGYLTVPVRVVAQPPSSSTPSSLYL